MAFIIFNIILITFAVIGFVEFVRGLVFRLFKPKTKNTVLLICPSSGHCEDIEFTLRSYAEKARWMGRVRPDRVICLDNGMDKSTREICEYICNDYDYMSIADSGELNDILKQNT